MAAVASITQCAVVNVLDPVTVDALRRCVTVLLIDMTGRAVCLTVGALKGKIGFAVIEIALFPVTGAVTAAAFLAQFTGMDIGFPVAAVTACRSRGVLFTRFMARLACRSGMHALERKIGVSVIERRRIQQHDLCVSAFVFGMAMLAVVAKLRRQAAVKAGVVFQVKADILVFMTLYAEQRLLVFVRCVMAAVAVVFQFCMCFDNGTGHQQGLQ
jgi:hypothetical protein